MGGDAQDAAISKTLGATHGNEAASCDQPQHVNELADGFLFSFVKQLKAQKVRIVDLFRAIDRDADGDVTAHELRKCLQQLGVDPSDEEFRALRELLDQDASGDISMTEFARAIRAAERRAIQDGRQQEVAGWQGPAPAQFTATQWALRTGPRKSSAPWSSAAGGPVAVAVATAVGSGSVLDSSVTRLRMLSRGLTALPPTSPPPRPPTPTSVCFMRALLEPPVLPSNPSEQGTPGSRRTRSSAPKTSLQSTRDTCRTALRYARSCTPGRQRRVVAYHGSPMAQATAIRVALQREHAGQPEFPRIFDGSAGLPSVYRAL